MVDIDVIIDDSYTDPKVAIYTKSRTRQVENIISAVENVSDNIVRVFTEGRKIVIQTDAGQYYSNKTLSGIEDVLNPDRFIRISQSEIINLYKVKCFEFNSAGTIGIELENGCKTWVARSRVKAIRELIKSQEK